MWGNVGMFYHITLFNTGVAFSTQFSSFLISVAMETKGTIPTLLHFWTFVQTFCPNLAKYKTF